MAGAQRLELGALGRGELERVGERPGPQLRAGVHVEGERGGAVVAPHLRGDEAIGAEVGAQPAMARRHAELEQARLAHVGVVLEREGRVAIVLRRARRELLGPELPHQCDQGVHGRRSGSRNDR
jgi:hypothetical protein